MAKTHYNFLLEGTEILNCCHKEITKAELVGREGALLLLQQLHRALLNEPQPSHTKQLFFQSTHRLLNTVYCKRSAVSKHITCCVHYTRQWQ